MITRLDHVVIGVHELDAAVAAFHRLGFDVRLGGKHAGRGTSNAVIRFGLDYLELLSVDDPGAIGPHNPWLQVQVDYLREREGALLGFGVATDDIESDWRRLDDFGIEAPAPFAMHRDRPDGRALHWRLMIPRMQPWRQPWPFVIQWDTPDAERLAIEPPGQHPNGAVAVAGLRVVDVDGERIGRLYSEGLGLEMARADDACQVSLGRGLVTLETPAHDARVAADLAAHGPGLHELRIAVASLDRAQRLLRAEGVRVERQHVRRLTIDPNDSCGARIAFVQA
jgi:catechol 2,3-dioxygenase-like lactoylglutathione lyase family enzyme